MQRVKQAKDIELIYDAASGLTLKVYTNMPGEGNLSLKRTISFPATVGRATHVRPFDESDADEPHWLEGVIFEWEITSPGVVRLYGGVVRVRPVGEYFNGANGEKWRSQPMDFAGVS